MSTATEDNDDYIAFESVSELCLCVCQHFELSLSFCLSLPNRPLAVH